MSGGSGRGYSRQRSKGYQEDYRQGGPTGRGDLHAESAARDTGIARALSAQGAGWVGAAKLAAKQTALTHQTLTADTLWEALDASGAGSASNNSAIAGIMKWAQGCGYMEPTDRSVMSTRDGRHRSRITVWRSLIYAPDSPERARWRETFGV